MARWALRLAEFEHHPPRTMARKLQTQFVSCHDDLLEREEPDVVLFETVERFVASFVMGDTIDAAREGLTPLAAMPANLKAASSLPDLACRHEMV